MSISTVLRQWCPACMKATITVLCQCGRPPASICKECRSGHLACADDE